MRARDRPRRLAVPQAWCRGIAVNYEIFDCRPFGHRHDGGLAIDVAYFRNADGTALNVERDFAPRAGERPCAPGPIPKDATVPSLALRKLVCDAFDKQLFHLSLTPDYDAVHRDHFHLEVTPGASTFVVR